MSADLAATAQDQRETDQDDLSPRQSLRQALDLNAWFDCNRAAEIALGIAAALDWAHSGGKSHVGLQPENIFIGEGREVFIADEGQRDDLPARIAAQYLSPEQVRGEPADARSDLYALGVVLYEMLTDRVPFDGSDAEAIKQKHLHRTPEPPNVFRTDTPDALSRLVMRLLDKRPDQRPQRAADLLIELQRIIEADTTAASLNPVSDTTSPDIFVLADFEPAETSREHQVTGEDSVLDLEFNDLFVAGPARVDDAGLMSLADDDGDPFAAASPDFTDLPLTNDQPDLPMADDADDADEEITAPTSVADKTDKAERQPAPVMAEIERDPFDLPTIVAIEPPAVIATAPPQTQLRLLAKINESEAAVAEPGDARLRWLALLLICVIAVAALLLYKVANPAATKPIEPASAQPASPPVQQAAPNAEPLQNDSPPATATEDGQRAAPSNPAAGSYRSTSPGRNVARGSRSHASRPAAQVRRRSGSSWKGQPSKRRHRAQMRPSRYRSD